MTSRRTAATKSSSTPTSASDRPAPRGRPQQRHEEHDAEQQAPEGAAEAPAPVSPARRRVVGRSAPGAHDTVAASSRTGPSPGPSPASAPAAPSAPSGVGNLQTVSAGAAAAPGSRAGRSRRRRCHSGGVQPGSHDDEAGQKVQPQQHGGGRAQRPVHLAGALDLGGQVVDGDQVHGQHPDAAEQRPGDQPHHGAPSWGSSHDANHHTAPTASDDTRTAPRPRPGLASRSFQVSVVMAPGQDRPPSRASGPARPGAGREQIDVPHQGVGQAQRPHRAAAGHRHAEQRHDQGDPAAAADC